MAKFLWSDAWFLVAVLWSLEDGCTDLVNVFATADGINHAILSDAEINGAVERLGGAGLIAIEGDGIGGHSIVATEKLIADAAAWSKRGLAAAERYLESEPWSANVRAESAEWKPRASAFTHAEIQAACSAYLQRVKR